MPDSLSYPSFTFGPRALADGDHGALRAIPRAAMRFHDHPAYRTPMSVRDVGLLDLARYLFRHHEVPLEHMEGETHDLFLDLREWADHQDSGIGPDDLFAMAEPEGKRLALLAVARHAPGGQHAG